MTFKQTITQPLWIKVLLIIQLIPMVMFPPESFLPTTQEWWLPVLLAVLILVAVVQIFRKSVAIWPWNLVSFSQGFNIISRLMMIIPHATRNEAGAQLFNSPYVFLSLFAMILSTFLLWYFELPEVRLGLIR